MLQGESARDLRTLVENGGGRITHDLPLIGAVGAEMTLQQLESILGNPLITRHLDDLSLESGPEGGTGEDAPDTCDVGGAVELQISQHSISWSLFNKRATDTELERLKLSWPTAAGRITGISLNDKPLDSRLFSTARENSLEIKLDNDSGPTLLGSGESLLDIRFSQTVGSSLAALQQSDFELEAHFAGDCSTKLIPGYADNPENFHYSSLVGADQLHRHGITGKGVTVAVLDSGLWEAPAIALDSRGNNRVIARYDAIADREGATVFDESGHGTHMTSVLAHSGTVTDNGHPTGGFQGIAPDANLIPVKAFNVEGQGGLLDIVRGIQWVVDNREKYDIRILNLSFASRPRWNYWLDPVNQAVMRAWASGIAVVAAAGNEGPDPMTVGSPGNLPYVITVGAITDSWTPTDRDDDYIPDFSSRGPTPSGHIKPDIVAPGGHITGLTRPGSTLTAQHPEYLLGNGDFVMTGSSQASALVAGIAALLIQLEPELTPDDIKCKLLSSAEPAINDDGLLAYSPFEQGHGHVSATRAVTLGGTGCGNPGLDIQSDLAGIEQFQGPAILGDDGNPSLPDLEMMVSPQPAEKGHSTTRKWGVKAHIERGNKPPVPRQAPERSAIDWYDIYLQEKQKISDLATSPAP